MQIHLPHCGTAVRRFCNTSLIFVEIEAKTEIENFTRPYFEATATYSVNGRLLLLWVCVLLYYIILYYIILYYIILYYIILYYIILYYIILYYIILYYICYKRILLFMQ